MTTFSRNILKTLLFAGVVAAAVPFATAMDHQVNSKLMKQSEAAATADEHAAAAIAFTRNASRLEAAAATQERIANLRSGRLYQRLRPAKLVDSSSKNREIADRLRAQFQQSMSMAAIHFRQAEELKLVD